MGRLINAWLNDEKFLQHSTHEISRLCIIYNMLKLIYQTVHLLVYSEKKEINDV